MVLASHTIGISLGILSVRRLCLHLCVCVLLSFVRLFDIILLLICCSQSVPPFIVANDGNNHKHSDWLWCVYIHDESQAPPFLQFPHFCLYLHLQNEYIATARTNVRTFAHRLWQKSVTSMCLLFIHRRRRHRRRRRRCVFFAFLIRNYFEPLLFSLLPSFFLFGEGTYTFSIWLWYLKCIMTWN